MLTRISCRHVHAGFISLIDCFHGLYFQYYTSEKCSTSCLNPSSASGRKGRTRSPLSPALHYVARDDGKLCLGFLSATAFSQLAAFIKMSATLVYTSALISICHLSGGRITAHFSSSLFTPRNPRLQLVRTCPWICSPSLARVSWKCDGFFPGVQTRATLPFHFTIVTCFNLHGCKAKDTDYLIEAQNRQDIRIGFFFLVLRLVRQVKVGRNKEDIEGLLESFWWRMVLTMGVSNKLNWIPRKIPTWNSVSADDMFKIHIFVCRSYSECIRLMVSCLVLATSYLYSNRQNENSS